MKCDLIKNHVETDSDRDRQRHTETDIEGLSRSFWAIWAYLGLSKLSAPIWPPTASALLKDFSRVLDMGGRGIIEKSSADGDGSIGAGGTSVEEVLDMCWRSHSVA